MSGARKTPMNNTAASRIQSTQAKTGAEVGKGSFSARAQSAAATNANKAPGAPASPPPSKGSAKKASGGGTPTAKPSKK